MQIKFFHTTVPFLIFTLLACNGADTPSSSKISKMKNPKHPTLEKEFLADLSWMNEPKSFSLENGTLEILAEKGTDFFNNPVDNSTTASAPFLYQEVAGNFVAKALVSPDFSAMWNAIALMVYIDKDNWIKFAFENSDATGKTIVSVVTKEVSDDSNGAILNKQDQIWLKLIRKDHVYSMLWSEDGEQFKMARLGTLPKVDSIKVGLEVQSPIGEIARHQIHYFEVEKTTVEDLRKGE